MVDVRRCTIADLAAAPNIDAVLAAYAAEGALPEIGAPNPQVETYYAMEKANVLHAIGAFDGDRLLGFILPIVIALPHYGVVTATVESFFVAEAERKHGIGLRLLRAAEDLVRLLGAKAMLVSAPVDGALAHGLHFSKAYRHSNEVFVRALA